MKNHKINVAAAVVCFHPTSDLVTNMETYAHKVSKIFIYSNSSIELEIYEKLFRVFDDKITFLNDYSDNHGLAVALNVAFKEAKKNGFTHILTMDQDSSFTKFYDLSAINKFDLVYPKIILSDNRIEKQTPPWIINSGSIISISCWEKIGGYNQSLFVDSVDFDLMMKIRYKNMRIKEGEGTIFHTLGTDLQYKKLMGFTFRVTNHSKERVKWYSESNIYLARIWALRKPAWSIKLLGIVFSRYFKIILFEKSKSIKIAYGVTGLAKGLFKRSDS